MNYWDTVWDKKDIEEYRRYIEGYKGIKNSMVRQFRKHNCHKVCDAACGFGANSLILQSNGFDVWGFDISEDSVWITRELLTPYGIQKEQFKTASLTDTEYPDGIKIKKGKLRGVESNGMMCGIEELGSSRDFYPEAPEDGVYVFLPESGVMCFECIACCLKIVIWNRYSAACGSPTEHPSNQLELVRWFQLLFT